MKLIYKSFLAFIFILWLHPVINAQKVDSIIFAPDRPGMATPPDILTFEKLQLESAVQYDHYIDATALYENYTIPTVLFRIGLLKNAEARISTDYSYKVETDSGVSSSKYGMDPITIGTKIKLFKQRKFLPKTSLLVNLTLPWYGNADFRPLYLAPAVYLLMSNLIFGQFSICYNYGLIWDGNKSPVTQFYALHLGLNLGKKLSIYSEGYGYSTKHKRANLYYDAGLAYLLNNHFQIDLSASRQYNSTNDYYLVNAGIAWQVVGQKLKF